MNPTIKFIRITQVILAFVFTMFSRHVLGSEHPLLYFLLFVVIGVSLEVWVWYKKRKGEKDHPQNQRTYKLVAIGAFFVVLLFSILRYLDMQKD